MKTFATEQKLRNKVILTFVLLSLGILFSMGAVSVYTVTLVRTFDVSQLELQLIAQVLQELEKFIFDIRGLFELQVGFEERAEISLSDQKFLLERMLAGNKALESVAFLNFDTGRETFRISREKVFAAHELGERAGAPEYESAKIGEGYVSSARYYNEDVPVVTLAAPVRNRRGDIISILAGEVNLADFQKAVSRTQLGSSGYVYVVDGEKNIIAHSRGSTRDPKVFDERFHPEVSAFIEDVLKGKIRTGIEKEDRYESPFGAKVIAAGEKSGALGWGVIAEWPEDDAMGVISNMIFQIVEFSLFAFAAVIVVSVIFVRRITKPLQELIEGAHIIGKGELDHRIAVTTKDEIGVLARSFNEMARGLKEVERLREIEIHNKALRETLKREQELSQIKDKFISVASHQLRTPISVLRWTLDLLEEGKNITKVTIQDALKDIRENTQKLAIIIGDLLTISEFGLGYYQKKTPERVVLDTVIDEVVMEYKKALEAKKITLTFSKPSAPVAVLADLKGMKEAVKNLIDNAITYTKDGGSVTVRLHEERGNITFTVTDTGIGIPEKEKNMVFTQFFRAKNSVEQKNVGTGLGLSVTKNIIEAYGGTIGFESQEGKGSTFWFTLPVVK